MEIEVVGPFHVPSDLCLSSSGDLLFTNTNRILKWNDGKIYLFAGDEAAGNVNGNRFAACFNNPQSLCLSPEGELFIADTDNHQIKVLRSDGSVEVYAGTGQQGFADGNRIEAQFSAPTGLCLTHDGHLLVADKLNHCIRIIDSTTNEVSVYAGKAGVPSNQRNSNIKTVPLFDQPTAVTIGPDQEVYVADSGNSCLKVIDIYGEVATFGWEAINAVKSLKFIASYGYLLMLTGFAEQPVGRLNIAQPYFTINIEDLDNIRPIDSQIADPEKLRKLLEFYKQDFLSDLTTKTARVIIPGTQKCSHQDVSYLKIKPETTGADLMKTVELEQHFGTPSDVVLLDSDGNLVAKDVIIQDLISAKYDQSSNNLIDFFVSLRKVVVTIRYYGNFYPSPKVLHKKFNSGFCFKLLEESLTSVDKLDMTNLRMECYQPSSCGYSNKGDLTVTLTSNLDVPIQIKDESKGGKIVQFDAKLWETADSLKARYCKQEDLSESSYRLMIGDLVLFSGRTLLEEGIDENTVIRLAKRDYNRHVFVKTLTGKTVSLHGIDEKDYVLDMMTALRDKEGIPIDQQRQIFEGKQLESDRSLGEYEIQNGSSIHVVLRLRGG